MKELQPLNQNVLLDLSNNKGEQKTAAGIIIRIDVEGISQFGRNAQGVKLMTLNDDDKVVSLAAVQQAEDDVTEEVITDDVQTETVDVSDEIIETSQATEE